MSWSTEPKFDDVFAKKRIRKHNTFGGKVIEILYDAKDENGNPVEAKEGVNDGHGTWQGIEANGQYYMFKWTHSASEGGQVEYGTDFGDNALVKMEEDILKKKDLVRSIEDIAKVAESESDLEKITALKDEYAALTEWGTPKEQEYATRIEKAVTKFNALNELYSTNRKEKEEILAEAVALKEETDFRKAKNAIRDLIRKMEETDTAGSDTDESFEDQIHDIEREIRAKEREFYANIEQTRANAKAKKEELIEESKKVLGSNKKFKEMGDQLNALFDEWKKAGNAGKDVDDTLWEQFNGVRKQFNEKRTAYFDKMNQEWQASADGKRALIEKAKEIAAANNFSKALTDQMKQLDVEWKKLGFSGKNLNDALWDEYNAAKKVFWDGKSEIHNKLVNAELTEKKATLESLKKEIEDLEYRLTIEDKPALKDEFNRKIQADQDRIQVLTTEVAQLEEKLK